MIQSEAAIYSQELIDEIYDIRNKRLAFGMPQLTDIMNYWAKSNYLPCQMDTAMTLAILDAKDEQERKEN